MSGNILIVEPLERLITPLKSYFIIEGFHVETRPRASAALAVIAENSYDLVIANVELPDADGIDLLEKITAICPDLPVVLMTEQASIDTAVNALRAGALDYLMLPVMQDEIRKLGRKIARNRLPQERNDGKFQPAEDMHDSGDIVGRSREMILLNTQIRKIARFRSSVLLLGETGTGKELFARAIHRLSPRRDMPFLAINCSAIPETLLESELFGYVKGAFTGATGQKKGLFEEAHRGTLFLDEIGDLSPSLQAKLLRVLDDREVRPVGSGASRNVDVRFVSATNRNLAHAVRSGSFREDLYFRINVVTINLPPLRERTGDVEVLARHFLAELAGEMDSSARSFDPSVIRMLVSHHWPGNVRELRNVIERAVLLCDGDMIMPEHLPPDFLVTAPDDDEPQQTDVPLSIENYTKEFILRHQSSFSEQEIASMLGITRKALWEKRRKWGLRR